MNTRKFLALLAGAGLSLTALALGVAPKTGAATSCCDRPCCADGCGACCDSCSDCCGAGACATDACPMQADAAPGCAAATDCPMKAQQ